MRSGRERQQWIEKCERIESQLRAAFSDIERAVPPADVIQIREWIKHNEHGLALETLLLASADMRLKLEPSTGAHLDAAATEMHGEAGLWQLPSGSLVLKLKENGFT